MRKLKTQASKPIIKEAINLSNNATNYFYYYQYQQFKKHQAKSLKSFENSVLWVPQFSADSIQQFDEFFVARRFVFLPTQDIILNEIASGESNLVWDILVLEKTTLLSIEKEKNWLAIVILHHGYGWSSRIYVKLWQVGPYSYLRNFPELWEPEGGRPASGSSYRKRKYEFTRRKLRNHETPPLLIEKSHVTRYHERRGQ